MKTILRVASITAALTAAMLSAKAATYTDPGGIGDFTGGSGFLDMSTVDVNNDANNLYFTIFILINARVRIIWNILAFRNEHGGGS